jgi:hypothetical protein
MESQRAHSSLLLLSTDEFFGKKNIALTALIARQVWLEKDRQHAMGF